MSDFDFESTSRQLATEQGNIHYHEAGKGPALLMIHGSGPGVSGWANFEGNLPFFAEHFRCLIIDLPGYGGSDPVEGNPVMECCLRGHVSAGRNSMPRASAALRSTFSPLFVRSTS